MDGPDNPRGDASFSKKPAERRVSCFCGINLECFSGIQIEFVHPAVIAITCFNVAPRAIGIDHLSLALSNHGSGGQNTALGRITGGSTVQIGILFQGHLGSRLFPVTGRLQNRSQTRQIDRIGSGLARRLCIDAICPGIWC